MDGGGSTQNNEEREAERCMDEYLRSLGLHRKKIAKDGSCLFRAVAEQVLLCQNLHTQVRAKCVEFLRRNRDSYEAFIEGDFEEYLSKVQDPQQWVGEVEINALAVIYKRDFLIYQDAGKPAVPITANGFTEKVQLCFMNGNHYDSVYPISHMKSAAICQSILYELLYGSVFKVDRAVLGSCQRVNRASDLLSDDNMAACASSDESDLEEQQAWREDGAASAPRHDGQSYKGQGRGRGRQLSERVRRSLNPTLFRNIEYDIWMKTKRAQQKMDFCIAAGMQYTVGDHCQVRLGSGGRSYSATIKEVSPSNGPVTVYIEELDRKHSVPLWNLRPFSEERWRTVNRDKKLSNGHGADWGEGGRGRGRGKPPPALAPPSCVSQAPGRVQKQHSWPLQATVEEQGGARASRKSLSSAESALFGLTEEERLAREEEERNVALVEIQLRDEHSFPALGTPPVPLGEGGKRRGGDRRGPQKARKPKSPVEDVGPPSSSSPPTAATPPPPFTFPFPSPAAAPAPPPAAPAPPPAAPSPTSSPVWLSKQKAPSPNPTPSVAAATSPSPGPPIKPTPALRAASAAAAPPTCSTPPLPATLLFLPISSRSPSPPSISSPLPHQSTTPPLSSSVSPPTFIAPIAPSPPAAQGFFPHHSLPHPSLPLSTLTRTSPPLSSHPSSSSSLLPHAHPTLSFPPAQPAQASLPHALTQRQASLPHALTQRQASLPHALTQRQASLPHALTQPQASLPHALTQSQVSLPHALTQPHASLPHAPSQPQASLPHAPSQPQASLPQASLPHALTQSQASLPHALTQPHASLPHAPCQPQASLPQATLPHALTQSQASLPHALTQSQASLPQATLPHALTQSQATLPHALTQSQASLPHALTQSQASLPHALTQPHASLPHAPCQPQASLPQATLPHALTQSQASLPHALTQSQASLPQATLPHALTQSQATLPHALTQSQASLPHALTQSQASLPHALTQSQASLPHALTQPHASLPHAPSQPQASLPHASLPHALTQTQTSLPHALTQPHASLPHAPSQPQASLPHASLPHALNQPQASLPQAHLSQSLTQTQASLPQASLPHALSQPQASLPHAITQPQASLPHALTQPQVSLPHAITQAQVSLPHALTQTQASLPQASLPHALTQTQASFPQASLPHALSQTQASLPHVLSQPQASLPHALSQPQASLPQASLPEASLPQPQAFLPHALPQPQASLPQGQASLPHLQYQSHPEAAQVQSSHPAPGAFYSHPQLQGHASHFPHPSPSQPHPSVLPQAQTQTSNTQSQPEIHPPSQPQPESLAHPPHPSQLPHHPHFQPPPPPHHHLPSQSVPGAVPLHQLSQLYQDILYPGFPLGDKGDMAPTPPYSYSQAGEDLPRDVNVMRFFFNLGVKAYSNPMFFPYMYLLPLQQAYRMHPKFPSRSPSPSSSISPSPSPYPPLCYVPSNPSARHQEAYLAPQYPPSSGLMVPQDHHSVPQASAPESPHPTEPSFNQAGYAITQGPPLRMSPSLQWEQHQVPPSRNANYRMGYPTPAPPYHAPQPSSQGYLPAPAPEHPLYPSNVPQYPSSSLGYPTPAAHRELQGNQGAVDQLQPASGEPGRGPGPLEGSTTAKVANAKSSSATPAVPGGASLVQTKKESADSVTRAVLLVDPPLNNTPIVKWVSDSKFKDGAMTTTPPPGDIPASQADYDHMVPKAAAAGDHKHSRVYLGHQLGNPVKAFIPRGGAAPSPGGFRLPAAMGTPQSVGCSTEESEGIEPTTSNQRARRPYRGTRGRRRGGGGYDRGGFRRRGGGGGGVEGFNYIQFNSRGKSF